MIQTLEWTDKGVRFIDQTKLPMEEVYVTCKTHEQVADVIRNMVVRGAPAIGVAAAMGIALGVNNSKAESSGELKRDLDQICDLIGRTRPTAVNLFWAIRRMQEKFERIRIRPIPQIKQLSLIHISFHRCRQVLDPRRSGVDFEAAALLIGGQGFAR